MSDEGEKVQVKVRFEYYTEKNEPKFSKPFDVKLVLSEDSFNENLTTIQKSCNFRKAEERFYYYIFDKEKNVFITEGNDLINYLKKNKNLTMKNCSAYARQMIELLREEEQRNNLGKNVNANNNNNADIALSTNLEISQTIRIDPKKKENIGDDPIKRSDTINTSTETKFAKKMFDFESNLNCDLFAEEFISYEGIKYLLSFLESASGNICSYALKTLNRLLDFQSSNDYINKSNEIIDIIYGILMKNFNIKTNTYSIKILMTIISQDQAKAKYLLNVAENYAKKSVTKIFSQFVNLLSINNLDLRKSSLILINILLNFCEVERFDRLKTQLNEAGIFESLEQIIKNENIKDKEWQEQLTIFQIKTGRIISGTEYELQVYENQKTEMEKKCEEMEIKYEESIEKQIMYERIIEELILYQENMNLNEQKDSQDSYIDLKEPKKRSENKNESQEIPYLENGIFDFVNIFKIDKTDIHKQKVDLMEKYIKTQNWKKNS